MSQHPDQESTILFQAMNSPRLSAGIFLFVAYTLILLRWGLTITAIGAHR